MAWEGQYRFSYKEAVRREPGDGGVHFVRSQTEEEELSSLPPLLSPSFPEK